MAHFKGKSGSVQVAANTVAETTGWDLSIQGQELPGDVQGIDWGDTDVGIFNWRATVRGFLDYGDTNGQKVLLDKVTGPTPDTSAVACTFIVESGGPKQFDGNARVVSAQIGSQVGNKVTVSMELRGSGAITPSWT